jgi:hypothetical protein
MATLNFSDALMEARRKAQLTGRPLSQSEMEGIAAGYTQTAADRAAQQKQLQISQQQTDISGKSQAAQETQFAQSQAQQQEQFAAQQALSEKQQAAQEAQFAKDYELAQQKFTESQSEFGKTFEESQNEFMAKMEEQQGEFGVQAQEWATQLGETQREFSANLKLAQDKQIQDQQQFDKTYQLQVDSFNAQRDAANRAYSQGQTNQAISAGTAILSIFVMAALLA